MSNVRKLMCHAEFTCVQCRKPFTSMAVVEIAFAQSNGALIPRGDAVKCGPDKCADCMDAERERENAEYYRQQLIHRKQKQWAGKLVHHG